MSRASNQIKLTCSFIGFNFDLFASDLTPSHLAVFKALQALNEGSSLFPVTNVTKVAPQYYQPKDNRGSAGKLNRGRVHQILEECVKIGVAEKLNSPRDRICVYIFESPSKVCSQLIASRELAQTPEFNPQVRRRQATALRQAIESQSGIAVLNGGSKVSVLWRLFNGILDGCIPASGKDPRKSISGIQYGIPFKEGVEWITVNTSTRSEEGARLMSAEDTDVMMALNAMYVRYISGLSEHELKNVKNLYVFDIVDLCEELGIYPNNTGRLSVANKLRRIRDTRFQLELSKAPRFREIFGFTGRDLVEVEYLRDFGLARETIIDDVIMSGQQRMLDHAMRGDDIYSFDRQSDNNLDVQYVYDAVTNRMVAEVPRLYYVSFYDRNFEELVTNKKSHRFIAHDGLKKERGGWSKRFITWARPVIGVKNKPGRSGIFEMYLTQFRDVVYPANGSMPMSSFHNAICKMVEQHRSEDYEKWNASGVKKALMFGYYFELDYRKEEIQAFKEKRRWRTRGQGTNKDWPLVRVYRDVHDKWVGKNSKHSTMLNEDFWPDDSIYDDFPAKLTTNG